VKGPQWNFVQAQTRCEWLRGTRVTARRMKGLPAVKFPSSNSNPNAQARKKHRLHSHRNYPFRNGSIQISPYTGRVLPTNLRTKPMTTSAVSLVERGNKKSCLWAGLRDGEGMVHRPLTSSISPPQASLAVMKIAHSRTKLRVSNNTSSSSICTNHSVNKNRKTDVRLSLIPPPQLNPNS
jgi:hypothetical protein